MRNILWAAGLMVMIQACFTGTSQQPAKEKEPIDSVQAYFEAFRDYWGLPEELIFVKEFSPFYKDDNPYNLDPAHRLKLLFYYIKTYEDPAAPPDTFLWGVDYSNELRPYILQRL